MESEAVQTPPRLLLLVTWSQCSARCWSLQIASFLLYLTDVEEGGETVFPQEVMLTAGYQRACRWFGMRVLHSRRWFGMRVLHEVPQNLSPAEGSLSRALQEGSCLRHESPVSKALLIHWQYHIMSAGEQRFPFQAFSLWTVQYST